MSSCRSSGKEGSSPGICSRRTSGHVAPLLETFGMAEEYRFLVVEDSPIMRQLITFSLKRLKNAHVTEASNGVDALKKLSEDKFHLLIVDINMPLMDGLKLLNIVRKDP